MRFVNWTTNFCIPRLKILTGAQIARRAAYQYQGHSEEVIQQRLKDKLSGESAWGMVVGDEIRLRQIITNLAR